MNIIPDMLSYLKLGGLEVRAIASRRGGKAGRAWATDTALSGEGHLN
jgi:hypothetical protein